MKFLIPPAKEMRAQGQGVPRELSRPSQAILEILAQASLNELSQMLLLKPEAAEKEARRFLALQDNQALSYPALRLFNGLMYRQIDRDLTELDNEFISKHIYITTAFYGIINAQADIAQHRLDFNCKVKVDGQSLKNFWRPCYNAFLETILQSEPVISLLSSEFESVFSPKLTKSLVRVLFQEEKDSQLKTHSTISKKGRGQLLNRVIKQKIDSIEDLKALEFLGFTYRPLLSSDHRLVFVKST